MSRLRFTGETRKFCQNRKGTTFLMALFMVMIIGILLGLTGQSWKVVMQREKEKELLFRGSQIKEAIENWYNPSYKIPGVTRAAVRPLTELKHLMEDPYTLTPIHYLPHSYATELKANKNRCGSDCPALKLYEDPMTGKEWDIIKCDVSVTGNPLCQQFPGANVIIGVASKSNEKPFRTSFKDTALENMGTVTGTGTVSGTGGGTITGAGQVTGTVTASGSASGVTAKMDKYSDWKFIADKNNDHSKIYRAYHEGW